MFISKAILLSLIAILASAIVLLKDYQSVMKRVDKEAEVVFGGVPVSSEYLATTATSSVSGTFANPRLLKTGGGALGSVTITGAGTGILLLVDATTTDINARTGQRATTTITLAEFPASTAAGTYVFDAQFNDGLILTRLSGAGPTSTITFR